MHLFPNQGIEDEFPSWFQNKHKLQQEEGFQAQVSWNSLCDARFSKEVVFVHPIVGADSNENEDWTKRNDTGIQESKPQHLQDLSVALAHQILGIFHQFVGPLLSQIICLLFMFSPLIGPPDIPRVDQPDNRHKEGREKEHKCLLLYESISFIVDVLFDKALDEDSHQGSSEEHSHGVFQHETELKDRSGTGHLEVYEVMYDFSENELIEEHDSNNWEIDDVASSSIIV